MSLMIANSFLEIVEKIAKGEAIKNELTKRDKTIKEKKLICSNCRYALVFKKDYLSYKCTAELTKNEVWFSENQPYIIACPLYRAIKKGGK